MIKRVIPAVFAVLLFSLMSCSKEEDPFITVGFSNDLMGEIRSCGCSSNDYGGLGRRATYITNSRKTTSNYLLFEGGDFFGPDANYGQEKASLTLQTMGFLKYDGIVPGEKDFVFGLDYLKERVGALRLPVVVANFVDGQSGERVFASSRIVELENGVSALIVGVLGPRLQLPRAIDTERFKVTDPGEAITAIVADHPDADLVIVLAHMGVSEARRLAETIPDIDLVFCGHDGRPMRKLKRIGNAFILEAPNKGRYMGEAFVTLDRKTGLVDVTSSLTPLSDDIADHEAIVKLFQAYDMDIANKEKHRSTSTLPSTEHAKNRYAGAEACKSCHPAVYDHWAQTKHAHAFDILVQQGREYDRDCTPCHTAGFYEIGGFVSIEHTPELINVQCESCHGNGHEHAKDPLHVKTSGAASKACTGCHNKDQTPDFQFAAYWPMIKHPSEVPKGK